MATCESEWSAESVVLEVWSDGAASRTGIDADNAVQELDLGLADSFADNIEILGGSSKTIDEVSEQGHVRSYE